MALAISLSELLPFSLRIAALGLAPEKGAKIPVKLLGKL